VLRRFRKQLPSITLAVISVIALVITALPEGRKEGKLGQTNEVSAVEGRIEAYLMEETGRLLADPGFSENSTGLTGLLEELSERLTEGGRNRTFTTRDFRFRLEDFSAVILPIFGNSTPSGVGRYTLLWGEGGVPAALPLSGPPSPRGIIFHVTYTAAFQEGRGTERLSGTIQFDYYTPYLTAISEFFSFASGSKVTLEGYLANMLNALVRTRAALGVGTRSGDSIFELLSPLDLELALNIALLLYEVETFGSPVEGSVGALERNFFNVSRGFSSDGEVNPTGFRVWSQQEKAQYREYLTRRVTLPDATKRRMGELLRSAEERGLLSPSELLLLYLVYDRALEEKGITVDPFDEKSVLSEKGLANPRDPYSTFDPANPAWMASLAPQDFWGNLTGLHPGAQRGVQGAQGPFTVKREQTYLVLGKDFEAEGLYTPRGWYTNVDLSRNESELINYNNTPTRGGGDWEEETRCGGVPLPPTPPDHDFRIKWEIRLRGEIRYTFSLPGGPAVLRKEVDLSPAFTVFCWYPERPTFPAEEITFRNINTGGAVQTQNYSMWLITPVANATEYYLKYIWQDLRDFFGWGYILGSLLRSSAARDMTSLPEAALDIYAVGVEATSAGRQERLSGTYASVKHFMERYIAGKGIHLSDLGYIEEDSFNMTLSYHTETDLFIVTATLNSVRVRQEFYRALSSPEGEVFMEIAPSGEAKDETGVVYSVRLPLYGTTPETPGFTLGGGSLPVRGDSEVLTLTAKEQLSGWSLYSEIVQGPAASFSSGVTSLNGSVLCWQRSLVMAEEGTPLSGEVEGVITHFLEVNPPHPSLPWFFSLLAREGGKLYLILPLWYLIDPALLGGVLTAPAGANISDAYISVELKFTGGGGGVASRFTLGI